ncbi:uncharacterized protein [Montipora foliosa]|uniref:uncharacterized protein isoform X1 n=2 Tax=Montipora foliosa TaxID=591990 RepID=UPI0035F17689
MSYMFRLYWVKHFTCLLVLLCTLSKYQGASITHGACICHDANGIYNLTSLQRTDEEPRFQTPPDKYSNVYFYNPCSSFEKPDEGGDNGCIIDAAVCLGGTGGPYYKIGDQSTAKCEPGTETEGPELVYKTAEYPGGEDNARVRLMCDWSKEKPDFKKIEDDKGRPWVFSLTHRCACPNGCPEDPSPTTSIIASSRTTGKTDELWSPLTVSLVVVVAVLCIILAVLSIRFCLRWWCHNEDNVIRQPLLAGEQNVVEVTENTFPKSDDGGRIENVLNVSQPLPVGSSNSGCNITVSKKHDFNKVKNASVPV